MPRTFQKILTEDMNLGTGSGTKIAPGGGILTGTQIGIHSFSIGGQMVTSTWFPGVISAGSSVSTTVTVPGAAVADFVMVSPGDDLLGAQITGTVKSANTVLLTITNLTGAAVDLSGGITARVLVFKSKG